MKGWNLYCSEVRERLVKKGKTVHITDCKKFQAYKSSLNSIDDDQDEDEDQGLGQQGDFAWFLEWGDLVPVEPVQVDMLSRAGHESESDNNLDNNAIWSFAFFLRIFESIE